MGCQNDTQDLEFQSPWAAEIVAPNKKKGMLPLELWPAVDKFNVEVLASMLLLLLQISRLCLDGLTQLIWGCCSYCYFWYLYYYYCYPPEPKDV